jgi:hypothetical protein
MRCLFQEDNFPYSHSTYLVDPPNALCYDQGSYNGHSGADIQPSSSTAPLCAYVDDDNPMSLYSVVHKNRKLGKQQQQQQSSGDNSIDEAPLRQQNFEDTESEYAIELRRQTYRQKMGALQNRFAPFPINWKAKEPSFEGRIG